LLFASVCSGTINNAMQPCDLMCMKPIFLGVRDSGDGGLGEAAAAAGI
jgi:hypothetical protein